MNDDKPDWQLIPAVIAVAVATAWPSAALRQQAPTSAALSVEIGPDNVISTSLPARPLVEPHVAPNPRDAKHIVAGVMVSVVDRAHLMQARCAALASFDGGRTWTAHMFAFPRCYDPWLAVLDDGTAVFVGLETNDLGQAPHLWLFRSPDGGRTWPTEGHSFGRGHDHPTMIVDRSKGPFHGSLYLTSTHVVRDAQGRVRTKAFVARSSDGGRTFPQSVDYEVSNMNNVVMTASLLPDGALLVPVTAIQRRVADERSAVALRVPHYWAIRSDDGGATFGPVMMISDACAGGPTGFPSLAVDVSASAYRGRAYAICFDGPRSGPYIIRSIDGGDRWSDPMHIPKTTPLDDDGQRTVASIAVNRDGVVAVSWHDRGPDTSSQCWKVMAAFSGDGGETFTDAHEVSTRPSCPAAGANGYAAEFLPSGGHYSGLAAAADGSFRLLWADSRGERYELRTARATVSVKR